MLLSKYFRQKGSVLMVLAELVCHFGKYNINFISYIYAKINSKKSEI